MQSPGMLDSLEHIPDASHRPVLYIPIQVDIDGPVERTKEFYKMMKIWQM